MKKIKDMEKNEIILNESLLVGKGSNRKCYIHPYNKDLCIKVLHKSSFKRGAKREAGYYKRLQKKGISFDMLTKYLYTVRTNQGEGDVFELIRDYDGSISKDIRYYLNLKNDDINQKIIQLLEKLRQYLKNEYILFSDLSMHNILLKKVSEREFKLILVDGLGDNNQIPFLEFVPVLGNKRSIKKWENFRLRWIKEFSCLEGKIKSFNE